MDSTRWGNAAGSRPGCSVGVIWGTLPSVVKPAAPSSVAAGVAVGQRLFHCGSGNASALPVGVTLSNCRF